MLVVVVVLGFVVVCDDSGAAGARRACARVPVRDEEEGAGAGCGGEGRGGGGHLGGGGRRRGRDRRRSSCRCLFVLSRSRGRIGAVAACGAPARSVRKEDRNGGRRRTRRVETAGGGSACVLGAHDRRKKRDVRRPLRAVNSSPASVLCSARAGAGVGDGRSTGRSGGRTCDRGCTGRVTGTEWPSRRASVAQLSAHLLLVHANRVLVSSSSCRSYRSHSGSPPRPPVPFASPSPSNVFSPPRFLLISIPYKAPCLSPLTLPSLPPIIRPSLLLLVPAL